jgi:hypothetical protein
LTAWLGADEIIAAHSKGLKLLLYNNKMYDLLSIRYRRYLSSSQKVGEEGKEKRD